MCDNGTMSTELGFCQLPSLNLKQFQHLESQKHKIIVTNLNQSPIQFHVGL